MVTHIPYGAVSLFFVTLRYQIRNNILFQIINIKSFAFQKGLKIREKREKKEKKK